MASLTEIRTALATTISAGISGMQAYPQVPESVNVPATVIAPRATDFQRAMGRGLDAQTFDAIVLVGRADDELAQQKLDPYVTGAGSSSIRQAIWNARTLGIDVDASVTGMTDYGGTWTFGGIDYVGARLTVEVLTSGTA